jgi:hypothetical protein
LLQGYSTEGTGPITILEQPLRNPARAGKPTRVTSWTAAFFLKNEQ